MRWLIAAIALAGALGYVVHDCFGQDQLKPAKRSADMLRLIEDEIDARSARLGPFSKGQGKDQAEAYASIADQVFAQRVGADRKKQDNLVTEILSSDDNGFAHSALREMVELLARNGERGRLTALLARRCPKDVSIDVGIEDCVIIINDKELHDGTALLCDAFDRSTDQTARRTIAAALRRGFAAMGIAESNDAKEVKDVREWYLANSSRYEPNLSYLTHFSQPRFPYGRIGVLAPIGKGNAGSGPRRGKKR